MHRGGLATTALTSVVLSVLAACGPKAGATAIDALVDLGRGSTGSADDILRQQKILKNLPESDFSADDWARRGSVLAQSDGWLADAVAIEVDGVVTSQLARLGDDAAEIVSSTTQTSQLNQQFLQDFAEVTKELVVGAACDVVLDTLAPEEEPDQPGEGSDWQDAAQEGYDKLTARWRGADFVNRVNWQYYATSVYEDGEQLARALLDHPDRYVEFASVPAVQRALVVYLRTCYSPPKPFRPGSR